MQVNQEDEHPAGIAAASMYKVCACLCHPLYLVNDGKWPIRIRWAAGVYAFGARPGDAGGEVAIESVPGLGACGSKAGQKQR